MANPIIPGFHPDPSICRVGADYWLVTSTCEYAPGLAVMHSRDLLRWRQVGNVFTRRSQLDLSTATSSLGLFAPTIRHDGSRFVVAGTLVGRGHFLMTTQDPAGSWSDPVWLGGGGWDPSPTFDGTDTYLLWTSGDAVLVRAIDPATGADRGPPRELWRGTGGNAPEGPHLYRVGRRWYLVIAEGGTATGHAVTVARADTIHGPYESCPHNPVLSHRGLRDPIQAVGHADLIEDPAGAWWAVLLGSRPLGGQGFQLLGRETFLVPVTWVDGWPRFGVRGRVPTDLSGLGSRIDLGTPPGRAADFAHDDHFDGALQPGWLFVRDPTPDFVSLSRDGLDIGGLPTTLNDRTQAFMGRRQYHHNESVRVTLDAAPVAAEEAGLALRRDEHHHYRLVLAASGSARVARVVARIGPLTQVVGEVDAGDGPVELNVTAMPNRTEHPLAGPGHYRFAVTGADGVERDVATLDARYLATEVAGGFTGVVIGLYASGNGAASTTPMHVTRWRSGADPRHPPPACPARAEYL